MILVFWFNGWRTGEGSGGKERDDCRRGVAVAAIGAVPRSPSPADSGAAAQSSLTVDLPPAVTDTIYAAPQARGRPIVVIDAGHGGRDPGATSVSGQVIEKDLTLALARELRDDLVKRGRVRVAMTRDDDRYLTLDQRAAVARRLNAAIFVSLHMDSAPNPLARGAKRLFAVRRRIRRRGGTLCGARKCRRRTFAIIGGSVGACSPTSRCARR